MNATASRRNLARRTRALRIAAGIGSAFAIAAPVAAASGPSVSFDQAPSVHQASTDDQSKGGRATDTVKKWQSPKSYTSPYALVEVRHNGKNLDRVPVSRCRGHYVDSQIDVLISTCGARWHVRASYVSLSGKEEPFRISYEALNRAP
jgi:hypothetical protein